jgi:hypothetical protein
VPKRGTDEWRRIHHLSAPRGHSINTDIADIELHYTTLQRISNMVRRLGRGCWLAKLDVKSAFRTIPVHPDDRHLLGVIWRRLWFVELALPFGLKSSPPIWERYSALAEWLARRRAAIREIEHYVDDFILGDRTDTATAADMRRLLQLFAMLGIPVNTTKFAAEGAPTQTPTILGVRIDTNTMTAQLTPDRLREVTELCAQWLDRTTCTKRELQALVGKLSFAARVVRPGRIFLARLLDTLRAHHHMHGSWPIAISADCVADISWWRRFVSRWNGTHLLYDELWQQPDVLQLWTDASLLGYGAVCGLRYMSVPWSPEQLAVAARAERVSMPYLELFAIVAAAAAWSGQWRGQRVSMHTDCQAAAAAANRGTARHPAMADLARTLHFICARSECEVRVVFVRGITNMRADLLSRLQVPAFVASYPPSIRSHLQQVQPPPPFPVFC